MYIVIRLVVAMLISVAIIFLTKRLTQKRFIKILIAVIPFLVLSTLLYFLPIENAFVDFSSPEKVYEYVNYGTDKISVVVEGENSDLVIAGKNGSYGYYAVPKNGDSWKIGVSSDLKMVEHKAQDGILVRVHHYAKSNDYYITVMDTQNEIQSIFDSEQSAFVSCGSSQNTSYDCCYAHIWDFDGQYWVNVNGIEISLAKGDKTGTRQGSKTGDGSVIES